VQARAQPRGSPSTGECAIIAGTRIAPRSNVDGTLKGRIRAHAREHRSDAVFVDRLLALTERIESEFTGERREQLLALAQDTFDRHVQKRHATSRARASLNAWREDQRRLLELLDFLSRGPRGARIH